MQDVGAPCATATTMTVNDTELEENKEELDDKDLIRFYFYKGCNIKKYACPFKENMGGKLVSEY